MSTPTGLETPAPHAHDQAPFPRLFEPYQMRGVSIRNRLVFGPHGSRFVDPQTHQLTEQQAAYLHERAVGG